MSRTLTVHLPSATQLVRGALAVLVVLAVIGGGALVGSRLTTAGEARSFAQSGRLQEVRLADGSVIVGFLDDDAGGYLRLSGAAEVRAGTGSQAGATIVQVIGTDPVDATGDMLISNGQVVAIMNVAAGSGLETAYRQATGQIPAPTAGPTQAPPTAT